MFLGQIDQLDESTILQSNISLLPSPLLVKRRAMLTFVQHLVDTDRIECIVQLVFPAIRLCRSEQFRTCKYS